MNKNQMRKPVIVENAMNRRFHSAFLCERPMHRTPIF